MKLILLLVFSIPCFPAFAQVLDIEKTEGIQSSLQKNNIGKIYFTNTAIPTASLCENHFLSSYTLTNKSDLFFVAFMNNSLTNYLHWISPDLAADSLTKIGNYQFTLFIDNKEIYKSNLLPGAPFAKILDTATNLNRPLINNTNGNGSWSESFWGRFLFNGGDSALTDGIHTLKMEIYPYIKADSVETGELIASGELKLNVLRNPAINISKISLNNVKPYDGFPISREGFDKNKIKKLKGMIDAGVFKNISGVIVVKNGRLLLEEYFNGETRSTLHDPRSVGKFFFSTITGIAIHDGHIKNEDEPLNDFYDLKSFENYIPQKENITIRDLLTMSSSFNGNDEDYKSPGNEENMYPTSDWVKFALDLSLKETRPAGKWHYFTAGVIILGDMLNKKVTGGLEAYADEKLFKPLHISHYKWQYTPQHVPNTAGGIQMNALDFAKYGQLYKNDGVWRNKQIIPKEWIAKTFTKQKQILGRNNEYYGYLFWNKNFIVGSKSYEAFYCAGNGGNYILVFRDLPLVIVITATAYGQPYAHPQVTKVLSDYILPAVIM
ncbi:MAG: serine hydrolase [Chitinophagaceae bacterium]